MLLARMCYAIKLIPDVAPVILPGQNRMIFHGNHRTTLLSWRGLLAGCALAIAVVATGCSNNPHPRPLHTTRPDGSPWVVYYSALSEDPRTLDPQVSYDTLGQVVISQFYEELFQYNLFKTDPYELEPCLAESMPKKIQNPDGSLAYEFHLKHGIFFHDDPCFPDGKGRELKAQDFAYTFQRIADPAVECPVLSTLQEFIVGLGPAYAEARKTNKFDYSKPTGAITVIDDYTFRLNLLKPYPQIEYWLAMPFTTPVPREAVEYYNGKNGRGQFKFHPVGTGPYRLAEWSRGRLIRLARNERYTATRFPASGWKPQDTARLERFSGKLLPFIDEVQFAIIREAIPAWLLFRQGYLDRSGVGKDVFNSVITAGQTLSDKYRARGVQLFRDVEPATFYMVFNMEDPVVGKNRKLRQALSTGFDQTRFNDIFSNGVDINAQQLLPPGVFGHDPGFVNPFRTENLSQAKTLLAEAGYPGGIDSKPSKPLELTLDVTADSAGARQSVEFVKSQIERLGIRCKIEQSNWARFQDKMDHGQFQLNGGSGWNADYPDPENFFFLFYSKNVPPQGNNTSRYSNPEFDRLFEKMATMEDSPERLELIRKMNQILVNDCPIILWSHPVAFSLNQPWIQRVSTNAMLAGGGGLKYVPLDPKLRDEKIREWNKTPWWPTWTLGGLIVCGTTGLIAWARKRNV